MYFFPVPKAFTGFLYFPRLWYQLVSCTLQYFCLKNINWILVLHSCPKSIARILALPQKHQLGCHCVSSPTSCTGDSIVCWMLVPLCNVIMTFSNSGGLLSHSLIRDTIETNQVEQLDPILAVSLPIKSTLRLIA